MNTHSDIDWHLPNGQFNFSDFSSFLFGFYLQIKYNVKVFVDARDWKNIEEWNHSFISAEEKWKNSQDFPWQFFFSFEIRIYIQVTFTHDWANNVTYFLFSIISAVGFVNFSSSFQHVVILLRCQLKFYPRKKGSCEIGLDDFCILLMILPIETSQTIET